MDFALDAEQQMLQDTARRFLAEKHPPSRARLALSWSDDAQRTLWRDMADIGWLGLLAPERQGGSQLGMCEAFLVAEAAGRQLLNLPFAASVVLLPLLQRVSMRPDPALAAFVEQVVTGRASVNVSFVGTLCLDHDHQCSHQLLVRGLLPGTGPVSWAEWPYVVATGSAPVTLPDAMALDPTLRSVRWESDSARTAGGCGLAWRVLDISPEEGVFVLFCYRMARVAELLGAASAALDLSCAYAREREQFGKPIGSYQAIKHHLADAWIALDNARVAALYAVAALDGRLSDWRFACAAAELTGIEGALRIGRDAIQVHGGLGFTWEHDAHLYLKRIHHVSAMLGGTQLAYDTLEHAIQS